MASTSGPAHRVQSAVIEYGYPQGHIGHLTEHEQEAFEKFKVACQEKGYYTPATPSQPPSHEDATMLRFLRARRFTIPDAVKQFVDTEDWRKANDLDRLYETIDLEHYEETRRLYPQWIGRRDRRGIPVYVYEVKHLTSKTMAAYEKSAAQTKSQVQTDGKTAPKLLRLFALYENLIRFVMPLCTAMTDREHPNTPITQSNNIVDISGVSLRQFWNLRGHMQSASQAATSYYPETLDRIFIIGAPSFFPTVWGWIKKWFDPITTSKIFILSSHDMKSTLESFIDPANIPVKYGGTLDYTFGDLPTIDPALQQKAVWEGKSKSFPTGPLYWQSQSGAPTMTNTQAQMTAVAVGSREGQPRNEKVCTIRQVEPANLLQPFLAVKPGERPDLARAPTADEFVQQHPGDASAGSGEHTPEGSSSGDEETATKAAAVATNSTASHLNPTGLRPVLETFVTAPEIHVDSAPTSAVKSTDGDATPTMQRSDGQTS